MTIVGGKAAFDVSARAYVALGANLGDAQTAVRDALLALDGLPQTRCVAASSLYRTAPIGTLPQPDFINAVAEVRTSLSPEAFLAVLLETELAWGRTRCGIPNAPRALDLDLLLYDDLTRRDAFLTLPHPRMHLRAFVLTPLSEIAPPELRLPGRGTLAAWLPAVAGQRVSRIG